MMSQHYYDLCCKHYGKTVRITDRVGRTHVGKIVRVTERNVYIQQTGRNLGGLGYGFFGPGFGYGYGYNPYAIPLSFITGLAVGGLFFW